MKALFSRYTLGWMLFAIGAFFFIGALADLDDGWTPSDTGVWWVFVFLPLAGGVALLATGLRASLHRRRDRLEQAIFDLARANQGALTAADLAGATALTLDQAQSSLSRLAARGHLLSHLRDDGMLVYEAAAVSQRPHPGVPSETAGGAVKLTQSLDEMDRQRRAATAIAVSFILSLLSLSLLFTFAGPFLWPATG